MKEEKPRTFDYEAPYRPNSFGVILGVTLVSPTQPSHPPSPRTRKSNSLTHSHNPQPPPIAPQWLGAVGITAAFSISILLVPNNNYRICAIGLFTTLMVLPLPKNDSEQKLGYKLGDWIMQQANSYFGLKVHVEDVAAIKAIQEKKESGCIVALEPHDILPYPIFSFNRCLNAVPGVCESGYGLMTGMLFLVPFVRHIYTYCRAHPVDKKTFVNHLAAKHTCVFVPGGVQEVLYVSNDRQADVTLFLEARTGFVKLALESGSPIVPAFAFNVDGSYYAVMMKGAIGKAIGRTIGFLPMVYFGRWGIPLGIPNPSRISLVVGPPIYVKKEENPSKESIAKYHREFVEGMGALYERHKVANGYGHRKLVIV
jgi:1-acyl-sn-glycerol-3-phosphate acyltransferase